MGFAVLLSLFLHPVVLCILLWIVARKNANLEFATVFFICLAITIGSTIAAVKLYPDLGSLTFVPIAVASIFLLMRFCYTSLVQSIIVLALFGGWQLAYNYALLQMIL
jgi:hypothetical protein